MGGSWSVIGKESLAIQGVGLVLIIAAMCWLGISSNILFEPVWSLPERGGSILLWFIGSHLEKCMHFNKKKKKKKKKTKKKQKEMEIFETEVTFEMIQG